jgi:hypothetical protein
MRWLVVLCGWIVVAPAMAQNVAQNVAQNTAQKANCPASLCAASWKRWPAADKAVIDQLGKTCGTAQRCAGDEFLPALLSACEAQKASAGALCEWAATVGYLARDFLGGVPLQGKPVVAWLRDDALPQPARAVALRDDAKALNTALGPSAWWHQASVRLGSRGRVDVKVEQRTLVSTLEPRENENRAETNQRYREGAGLRLGESFDLSGITYEAEQAVRLRFGDERLSKTSRL